QVGTTIYLWTTPCTTSAAEDLAKDIAQITEATAKTAAHTTHTSIWVDTRMTVLIVGLTFLIVVQNFVSFFSFFKFSLGFLTVGISIRMVFHGHLAISLPDLVLTRVFCDAEYFV